MICCGPLDDGYETEKIKALLLKLECVQNVGRVCICFVFCLKNFSTVM